MRHPFTSIVLPPTQRRLSLRSEIALVLLPTATVLGVLAVIDRFDHERLLFTSLAASAFLIYLDPHHRGNTLRALVISQTLGAIFGSVASAILGPGFWSAAVAMVVLVAVLIALDAVHPPGIATALAFTFRPESVNMLLLFGIALVFLILLVGLQWVSARLIAKMTG